MRALLPLLLGSVLALAVCSGPANEHETAIKIVQIDNDPNTPTKLVVDGMTIEILGDLKAELGVCSISPTGSLRFGEAEMPSAGKHPGVWVRGNPITVLNGHLRIGGRDFGTLKEGQSVVIDRAGIHVDHELRGELPARP